MIITIFLMKIVGYYTDKRNWNNGFCPNCGGKWISFDMASDLSVGFKCNNGCENYHWQLGNYKYKVNERRFLWEILKT